MREERRALADKGLGMFACYGGDKGVMANYETS